MSSPLLYNLPYYPQKPERVFNPQETKLQTLASDHVDAGKQTQFLYEACLLTTEPSLKPMRKVFLLTLLLEGESPTPEFQGWMAT